MERFESKNLFFFQLRAFKMAFRARKLPGTFEKRVLDQLPLDLHRSSRFSATFTYLFTPIFFQEDLF